VTWTAGVEVVVEEEAGQKSEGRGADAGVLPLRWHGMAQRHLPPCVRSGEESVAYPHVWARRGEARRRISLNALWAPTKPRRNDWVVGVEGSWWTGGAQGVDLSTLLGLHY
jgi:hypothetical protein